MSKIKITGVRSVETKSMRLVCELREDARRICVDHETVPAAYTTIVRKLNEAAALLSNVADLARRS